MSRPNEWGFKSKIKWVLIDEAPLTGSGLNEILYAAEYRSSLVKIAKIFGLKLTGRNAYYKIVKLEDCYPTEDTHGD